LLLSVANIIATALVASKLDDYNSLFQNIAFKDITTLPRVQHCLPWVGSNLYSFYAVFKVSALALISVVLLIPDIDNHHSFMAYPCKKNCPASII